MNGGRVVSAGGRVVMGSSAVKRGEKSADWKIRKHNLSQHCQRRLSRLSCRKSSTDSQGEACAAAASI